VVTVRKCVDCDAPLAPPKGRGRPPKRCDPCRGIEPEAAAAPVVREIRPGVAQSIPTLAEATERKLREAERLDDPAALVVLQLARSIDAGGHSGASLASLSREFRAALDSALADAAPAAAQGDGVDWNVG
jgi:hypothetical protein